MGKLSQNRINILVLFALINAFCRILPAQIQQTTPDSAELGKGIQLYNYGNWRIAREFFIEFVKDNPDLAEGNYYMGRIFFDGNNVVEAENHFRKAIDLQPENAVYHLWLGRLFAARTRNASLFQKGGLLREARTALRQAMQLGDPSFEASDELISLYLDIPWIAGGGSSKAWAVAESLKSKNPARSLIAHARIHERKREFRQAEKIYEKAVSEFPESLDIRLEQGGLFQLRGKFDEAFETCQGILDIDPQNKQAMYQYGRTGALSGQDLQLAEQRLKRFIELEDPGNVFWLGGAYWRLAMVYQHMGNQVLARDQFEQGLGIDSNRPWDIITPRFYTYSSGDSEGNDWTQPDFDDNAWELIENGDAFIHGHMNLHGSLPLDRWPGIGRFRFVYEVDSTQWNVPKGLSMWCVGGAEFYVDGKLVHKFSKVGSSQEEDYFFAQFQPNRHAISFQGNQNLTGRKSRHVIAVRHSNFLLRDPVWTGFRPPFGDSKHSAQGPSFDFAIGDLDLMATAREQGKRRVTFHQALLVGAFFAFAIIHFLLYLFYPKMSANFYFAMVAAGAAMTTYLWLQEFFVADTGQFVWRFRLLAIAFGVFTFSSIRFTYLLIYPRLPRLFFLFCFVSLVLTIWFWLRPFIVLPFLIGFSIVVLAEIVRALLTARIKKRKMQLEGSGVILLGLVPFSLVGIYYLLASDPWSFVSEPWDFYDFPAPFYAILILMISMSIFLARNFARTSRSLEAQLIQVRELSEKELAREREASERLRRIDKLKDDFLANTSHELRTPLHGIIGLAESLIDGVAGKLPKNARANLSLVVASGRRLSSLVNDILDFSKLKRQDLQLQIKPIDMRVLTDLVLKFSEPLLSGKKLGLANKIPADIPPVDGDENRLQQILHNLVGNAIKFTDSGKVEVCAIVNNDMVEISVSDTGIGIPQDKHEKIFQSFEQVDASVSREYGGTGLGLAVTKQLVELHGGRIWLESRPGKGAKFTFSVPVSAGKPAQGKGEEASGLAQESNLAAVRAMEGVEIAAHPGKASEQNGEVSVLVVDDEPINQQVLANHMAFVNYRVTQALNGEEALKAIASGQKFDLVLLDIMMPKMSGYDVCQKIRETHLPGELPVIMVTAKNQVSDLVQGFSSGANDYVAKPFTRDELLARMKTQLNLAKINSAYGRFVPHEFLRFLGKESMIEVQLGDNVQMEMTIFVSDIRSFTSISEKMSPEENFKFINDYLAKASPIIREHGGFVDRYSGDAIMALFPNEAEDAVRAAIATLHLLERDNPRHEVQSMNPLQVGIGLHTGSLMLGIVGERERAQGDIFSDAVNLANRIEGLSKLYGVSIVVSEKTLKGLPDANQYNHRFLGKVQVKGKKESVSVYEIYDGDPEPAINLKIETKSEFEQGLRLFFDREFAEAAPFFKKVLKANPVDKTAKLYLERSAQFMVQGVPDDWEGVETMDSP